MLQKVRSFFNPQPREGKVFESHQHLTPDIWRLEQFAYQNVFVCDNLMSGKELHEEIKEYAFSGSPLHPTCYTFDKFTFFKKDLGQHSFPIPMPWDYKPSGFLRYPVEPARVRGELYTIRPNGFIKLDKLRQNGVQFHRQRVRILLPYREVRYDTKHILPKISEDYITSVSAWMYVGAPRYWDDQIGGIFQTSQVDTLEFDTPKVWIDKFYKF